MLSPLCTNSTPQIHFKPSQNHIKSVEIETARLLIRTVTENDQFNFESLYSNPIVMNKFATGDTKDSAYVQKRITTWVDRWNKGDPFSGFAVYEKQSQEFMGLIVLGHGDVPGQSEIAFMFLPKFWNQGFGKEAVSAIIENYAPLLAQLGVKLDGIQFNEIVATSRLDNIAGNKILGKFMHIVGQEEKFGSIRNKYSRKVEDISCLTRITTCLRSMFGYIRSVA